MHAALVQARAGATLGEIPVGAVMVRAGAIIASAHNETVARRDPTAHAELLVMQRALQHGGAGRLSDATLYVTLEPCAQCAGAIVLSKVGRVVYGARDDKAGMAGSVVDLLRHPSLNHHPEVWGGVLAEECGALLRGVFEKRRAGR